MLEAETLIRLHGLRRDTNTEKSASEAETTPKDFGAETLSKARDERVVGIRTRFSVVADQAAERKRLRPRSKEEEEALLR